MPLFQNHCATFIGNSAPFNQNLHAIEYDIEDYVSLLQAIMMQESGGKGNDPMQASESGYNTKFPRVPNGITEPEYP